VTFCNEFLKDLIHHALECGGGVDETKKHDKGSKKAMVDAKGGFLFVSFLNADIRIFPPYVKFGKYACALY
jgi:hypothetical protein